MSVMENIHPGSQEMKKLQQGRSSISHCAPPCPPTPAWSSLLCPCNSVPAGVIHTKFIQEVDPAKHQHSEEAESHIYSSSGSHVDADNKRNSKELPPY